MIGLIYNFQLRLKPIPKLSAFTYLLATWSKHSFPWNYCLHENVLKLTFQQLFYQQHVHVLARTCLERCRLSRKNIILFIAINEQCDPMTRMYFQVIRTIARPVREARETWGCSSFIVVSVVEVASWRLCCKHHAIHSLFSSHSLDVCTNKYKESYEYVGLVRESIDICFFKWVLYFLEYIIFLFIKIVHFFGTIITLGYIL